MIFQAIGTQQIKGGVPWTVSAVARWNARYLTEKPNNEKTRLRDDTSLRRAKVDRVRRSPLKCETVKTEKPEQ